MVWLEEHILASTIGMVGVGRMGANMARRLVEQGFKVVAVNDARPQAASELAAELGALACSRLADVTAAADVVITVVSDDAASRQIFMATDDNLLMGSQGKLFINCATLTPAVHQEIERAAHAAGAEALEACMASSITQAREGTLYLMCGGQTSAFERALPVLDALGSSVRFVGAAGEAAKVKALVNMVMNINTAALAEGLGLGHALGLDLTMLREIFAQTGAGSRVLVTDGEDMQNRDHDCYFSAAHAQKDTGIALALGQAQGMQLPLAEATLAQYGRMVALGLGELDKSGIAELTFKGRNSA
jgi:3-hydroxyisobutyrate dehydrogenase